MTVRLYGLFFALISLSACSGNAQEIVLTSGGQSSYKIVIPKSPTPIEQRSAKVLQNYIQKASGATLPVTPEGKPDNAPAIYIGHTTKGDRAVSGKMADEGSLLKTDG